MNSSMIIGMAIGVVISFSAGGAIWMLRQPARVNEAPASISATARRERAENFFGGNPDRDVRGGQDMRPRW